MLDERQLRDRIVQATWKFSREGGDTFSTAMRLGRDGRVRGYDHRNESRWRVRDGAVEFLRNDGWVSCRLDETFDEPGLPLRFRGRIRGEDPPAFHLLEDCGAAPGQPEISPGRRVAVLVRTHLVNEKILHLVDSLCGSPLFDVYLLADETNGKLDVAGVPTVSQSLSMCSSLGLNVSPSNHSSVMWFCGDYGFYCTIGQLPDYDFFIMVEWDVHFVRENPLFLEGIASRMASGSPDAPDLITARMDLVDIDYGWSRQAARMYTDLYWSGIFAVVAMSKRAVLHLFETRIAEGADPEAKGELVMSEAFCLTALMNTPGFRCVDLGTLFPGCIDLDTFHPGTPELLQPNYLLGANPPIGPRIEMIHPCLDAPNYLERLWQHHRKEGRIDAFVRHVEGIESGLLPENLRVRYLREAAVEQIRIYDEQLESTRET